MYDLRSRDYGQAAFSADENGGGADSVGRKASLLTAQAQVSSNRRVQIAQADEVKLLIATHCGEMFNDPDSPVGGNPAGDITIVEFFDYNCPYCCLVAPTLQEIERTRG
jgi:protein-disulfide isomerase